MQLNDSKSASESSKPLTSCLKTSKSSRIGTTRSRKQQSSIVVVQESSPQHHPRAGSGEQTLLSPINYWHYKKTGIKSRPIKLLEHPIEHIERKLVYTYLLGILFKILAILFGPIISLLLLLLALPFLFVKRIAWYLLNLKCLFDAHIKTPGSESSFEWKYCPLTYLESYWYREKLLNHIILVVSNGKAGFSLVKLGSLIEQNVLSKPRYRKFLSCVVGRGIPFYRSYYWLFCGESFINDIRRKNSQDKKNVHSGCEQKADEEVSIDVVDDLTNGSAPFTLDKHVFLDKCLSGFPVINLKTIRDYTYNLLDSKLDPNRPLWELRAIPSTKKTYLIFRCHQCLADGKNLSKILVDHLTSNNAPSEEDGNMIEAQCDNVDEREEEDESKLVPIREKKSFISRMGKSSGIKNAIIVGPLTVLLWVIWTFTRRKNNHLNKCGSDKEGSSCSLTEKLAKHKRRFHMNSYDLTRFHQIKQITRSTVTDIILCALSGSIREYLRKLNAVSNPPNLNVSLSVDMNSDLEKTKACDELVDYTLVSVPLPTSVEGTIPRLWDLRNTMEELRTSLDPWVIISMEKFLFTILPVTWYQWLVNYITLRNSSVLVSNIRGPVNTVESWCIDLMQKAVQEAQKPPKIILVSGQQQSPPAPELKTSKTKNSYFIHIKDDEKQKVSAIYYCLQPPTSKIPISFNCITYRNKLFITALSRSLLVEDSKILIKLFFRQLDQLIDSVAKRRKAFTIISGPAPQELEPEVVSNEKPWPADYNAEELRNMGVLLASGEGSEIDEEKEKRVVISRYDLEASIECRGSAKCKACNQTICTCKRRKSMFSIDYAKHSGVLSKLMMNRANTKNEPTSNELQFGSQGNLQVLVVDSGKTESQVNLQENSQVMVKRSSLSLDAPSSEPYPTCSISNKYHRDSAMTFTNKTRKVQTSTTNEASSIGLNYSKSDTNLSPTGQSKSLQWAAKSKIGSKSNDVSSRMLTNADSENINATTMRSSRQIPRTPSRVSSVVRHPRRQSIATTSSSGIQQNHTRLLVKDELNLNVDLRYHLDKAFLRGCQSRRSKKQSKAGDKGRRSSLIPFGLLPSQNMPKLLQTDLEAHL